VPRNNGDPPRAAAADAGAGAAAFNAALSAALDQLAADHPDLTLYRLDVAFPVSADRYARWELRLSNVGGRRSATNEPGDLARSRERTLPTSIFTWP
jgi:hypothetical protein